MTCLVCGLEIGRSISVAQVEAVIHQLSRPTEDEGDPRWSRLCSNCRALHVTLREQQQAKQQSTVAQALLGLDDVELGVVFRDFMISALHAVPAEHLGHFGRAVLKGDMIKMSESVKHFVIPPEVLAHLTGKNHV